MIDIVAWVRMISDLFGRLFKWFRNARKEKLEEKRREPAESLKKRFIEIFEAHQVLRAQIPLVLGLQAELRPIDVLDDDRLLQRLDEEMLSRACERFGINRAWLDGEQYVGVHPRRWFYKNIGDFVDWFAELHKKGNRLYAHFIKSPENELDKSEDHAAIAIVIQEEILLIGNKSIYRYYVIEDTWPWAHPPAREELKQIVWILWQFGVSPWGGELAQPEIDAIIQGKLFPAYKLEYRPGRNWHPDDYVFPDSQVVKDIEEAREIQASLKESGLWEKTLKAAGKQFPDNP